MRRLGAAMLAAAGLVLGLVALPQAQAGAATTVKATAVKTPVVFVHGYLGVGSDWPTAKSVFQAGGYTSSQLFTFSYNYNQSNEKSAKELATFVNSVKSKTGSAKVDLVSHSMGGMVTRWYIKQLGGQPSVAHWASLAGANHGTTYAGGCLLFQSCQQMYPGSSFLRTLNSGDETPGNTKYATWYSPIDGIILPYTSTPVTGATNNFVAAETHIGFLSNRTVLTQVRTFLAS